MATESKTYNAILAMGVVLCLLQIWLPDYYLTCDGPAHLYNARIVLDIWCNKKNALYSRFYDLVYTADPNSMATYVLAVLSYFFRGAIAEKVYLSLYVLVYISGFAALIRRVSNGNSFWQISVFVMVFTYALSKGFYNFSFGVAFYCWVVWSWMKFADRRSVKNGLLFFLLSGCCFFTHLLPFVFSLLTCASLGLSHAYAVHGSEKPGIALLKNWGRLLLLSSPYLLLTLMFTGKEGGLQLHLSPYPYRLLELLEFKYIINVVNEEKLWAAITGIVLSCLFLLSIFLPKPLFKIHRYDGFLLALIAVVFVYTFFPEDFMGRAIIISIRAQLFVYLIIAIVIGYRLPAGVIKNTGAMALMLTFVVLSLYRISCRINTDSALQGYLSVNDHIATGSVLLPFDFSPTGTDDAGNPIADRNALFHHAAQYLGAEKPLIILDNYEANMGYFPVRWNKETNPYNHLSKEEGIEGLPPFARIMEYRQKTGVTIDYILFWCYNPKFLNNSHFRELYAEINANYHRVYNTRGDRTILYELNK